jgi:hypothetical protein
LARFGVIAIKINFKHALLFVLLVFSFSGYKTDRSATDNAVTGGSAVAGLVAGVVVGAKIGIVAGGSIGGFSGAVPGAIIGGIIGGLAGEELQGD